MSNALTGDFDAVLQVSGSTINRLMATLHQNAYGNLNLPSFPHSLQIRIGDFYAVDGVRGAVQLQVGAPLIDLIDGSTDRFGLEVGVRAWFRPDYGTAKFPAFINGTVYAEYQLTPIDPSCLGWSQQAANFLWIQVVPHSVKFTGTSDDDTAPLDSDLSAILYGLAAADPATTDAIQRQIALQLATAFVATPHPVSAEFQRGAMRSLNGPGGSALVTAVPLNAPASGSITSVNNVLLDGADMAVGVSIDFVMLVITPALDPIKSFKTSVSVTLNLPSPAGNISTAYDASVTSADVAWLPGGASATVRITIKGDAATKSVLASATFEIVQDIVVAFDAGGGALTINPGHSTVTATASGLASDTVAPIVKNAILAALPPIVQAACDQVRPSLSGLGARTQELTQQLRTLDGNAAVSLTSASFSADGIVLFGAIALSPRAAPQVAVAKLSDSFSALQSWIPGGRIDKFEWSWSWGGLQVLRPPGSAEREDRFLLRRPRAAQGRWGQTTGVVAPLPGLDGIGSMCLTIVGAQVDPASGALLPVQSVARCTAYGVNISGPIQRSGRLFVRDLSKAGQRQRIADLPLVSIGTAAPKGNGGVNTLVLVAGRRLDRETASTLQRGLRGCARHDAGLTLLVLFDDSALERRPSELAAPVEALAQGLGIAVNVNEDVQGGWSRALGRSAGTAWAIVSPDGRPVWTHVGALDPDALTSALNSRLGVSPRATPRPYGVGSLAAGRIVATQLLPDLSLLVQARCPPPPIGMRGIRGSTVTFVQKDSAASVAELGRLTAASAGPGGTVVAIIDGASQSDVGALKARVGNDFLAIADSKGTVCDRFGIEVWPTTLSIDATGIVSEVVLGGVAI
jgi:hypothetical protein